MSAAALERLIAELETQDTLSADTARWLHSGACEFLAGRARSLDLALGLRGRGIALPATQTALRARDNHLRAAFALVIGATPHQRLLAFTSLVARFGSDTWPRVRNLSDPPTRLNAIQQHLFRAFAVGLKVPGSYSMLAAIVNETP